MVLDVTFASDALVFVVISLCSLLLDAYSRNHGLERGTEQQFVIFSLNVDVSWSLMVTMMIMVVVKLLRRSGGVKSCRMVSYFQRSNKNISYDQNCSQLTIKIYEHCHYPWCGASMITITGVCIDNDD